MKHNMFLEMKAVMHVREILDQSELLEAAFDLKTRRIYYYTNNSPIEKKVNS